MFYKKKYMIKSLGDMDKDPFYWNKRIPITGKNRERFLLGLSDLLLIMLKVKLIISSQFFFFTDNFLLKDIKDRSLDILKLYRKYIIIWDICFISLRKNLLHIYVMMIINLDPFLSKGIFF